MISVVLDANTIASGILGYHNPKSTTGKIIRLWRKEVFILVISQHIRDEVKEVLHKAYFRKNLTAHEISRIHVSLHLFGMTLLQDLIVC